MGPSRALFALLVLVLPLVVAGCAASTTSRPLTISVRDGASRRPVASAVVHARTLHFFVPSPPQQVFDPSPPPSSRGVTDEAGTVRLDVVDGHPVQIIVVMPGYALAMVELDRHPAETTGWLDATTADEADGTPALQVRIDAE